MTKLEMTDERFYSGLTIDEFASGMKENKEKFAANLEKVELGSDIEARLAQIDTPIKAIVIAEDWCGDVLRYLPVFTRLVEQTSWQVRVFYRDANPDLMDHWLKDGKHKAIPVIAFFDENWNELGYYQEKPAPVYTEEADAIANFARIHTDLPDSALPYAEMSQPTKELYAPYMLGFRADRMQTWQNIFVDQILGIAQGKAEKQPELTRS